MTIIEQNQRLLQNFERILPSEELISIMTHDGLIKVASYNAEDGLWKRLDSDFDHMLGSILDVDVHQKPQIDTESVAREMLDKLKAEAAWMLTADFDSVVLGLKEIEEVPIASLKKDEPDYAKIRFWQDQIIDPWLASPMIYFYPEQKEKMEKLSMMINNYTDLKLYFDNYVNKILPTYRSLLANESMKSQLSDDKKQNFIENMEYLKKVTVKQARKYLKEQAEITMDKIYILFKDKVNSSEELIEVLNK